MPTTEPMLPRASAPSPIPSVTAPSGSDYACRICGNQQDNRVVIGREMMFGRRDAFEYVECAACGCVQIKEPPADMRPYYPADYYSFDEVNEGRMLPTDLRGRIRCAVKAWLVAQPRQGLPGVFRRSVMQKIEHLHPWLAGINITGAARILDVGCGAGELLLALHRAGFRQLLGIDPYIKSTFRYQCGLEIRQARMEAVSGNFDLIMMHHAFEHMDDPLGALVQVRRLLAPTGCAVIRIPVADSLAWRRYRENWVQLDAPRHFFLHTRKSVERLAQKAGLALQRVTHDSTAFQFAGSETYVRGYPLNHKENLFTEAQLAEFSREAERANQRGEGDQAVFYLAHAGSR